MAERNYWQRIRQSRVSRRALLRASVRAGVGATGLALVGCGDNEEDGPRSVTQSALQQDNRRGNGNNNQARCSGNRRRSSRTLRSNVSRRTPPSSRRSNPTGRSNPIRRRRQKRNNT